MTARLVWRTEKPLPENYAIGVQLVTPDWRPLAQRDSFPGGGLTATSLWTPGAAVEDRHPLWVSAAAERPQQAQLAVAVYDRRTGVPLPAVDASGHTAGPAVPVALLRVPPPASPASATTQIVGRFPALGVAVERAELRPSASASAAALDVALAWRTEAEGARRGPLRLSLQL
ncbi:MAG: hypothetical protein NTZ05_05575, partial [Chloroflexi bacterium]|nr:hypothetical protein [Chloroflexota bacterium]